MIFPGGAFAAFGLGAGLGYVAGSFPSAYLAGRLMRGVDLRTVGSGNLGATNVLREVGIPAAVAVLLIDAAKGWAPVALLPDPLGASTSSWLPIAIGAGAVLGHTQPLFLLWKGGGKGVATAAGVFLALAPLALAVAVCVFVIGVAATRFVSVGSIAAAAALPFAVAATAGTGAPVFLASIIVGLYVVWMHRANIGRLLRGEEPPLRAARRKE
jgi:glycerol-3-phosphate acyltransferase PlsY